MLVDSLLVLRIDGIDVDEGSGTKETKPRRADTYELCYVKEAGEVAPCTTTNGYLYQNGMHGGVMAQHWDTRFRF